MVETKKVFYVQSNMKINIVLVCRVWELSSTQSPGSCVGSVCNGLARERIILASASGLAGLAVIGNLWSTLLALLCFLVSTPLSKPA